MQLEKRQKQRKAKKAEYSRRRHTEKVGSSTRLPKFPRVYGCGCGFPKK